MSLSDEQYKFARDLIMLLTFIWDDEKIDKFSLGEVWRQQDWQDILVERGYSSTRKSRHIDKQAIDLYFWIDGVFVDNTKSNIPLLQHVGDFWCSLDPLNQWGGNWKFFTDVPHFERREKK
jgi:hypothetical protein